MRPGGEDLLDPTGGLPNPYLSVPGRPAIWGVTLGRVGLAAVGVLAVAGPVGGATAPPPAGARWGGATEVLLGAATDVALEVQTRYLPGGYLWPSEPLDGAALGSPALV